MTEIENAPGTLSEVATEQARQTDLPEAVEETRTRGAREALIDAELQLQAALKLEGAEVTSEIAGHALYDLLPPEALGGVISRGASYQTTEQVNAAMSIAYMASQAKEAQEAATKEEGNTIKDTEAPTPALD